jgi:hypothetical protein
LAGGEVNSKELMVGDSCFEIVMAKYGIPFAAAIYKVMTG